MNEKMKIIFCFALTDSFSWRQIFGYFPQTLKTNLTVCVCECCWKFFAWTNFWSVFNLNPLPRGHWQTAADASHASSHPLTHCARYKRRVWLIAKHGLLLAPCPCAARWTFEKQVIIHRGEPHVNLSLCQDGAGFSPVGVWSLFSVETNKKPKGFWFPRFQRKSMWLFCGCLIPSAAERSLENPQTPEMIHPIWKCSEVVTFTDRRAENQRHPD